MIIFFKLKCAIVCTLFSLNLFAQQDTNWVEMMENPNSNFYDVQQAFENYWEGKTIEKGKGYKQFKRWEDYMAPRVYPSGDMTLPSLSYQNFLDWQAKQNQGIPKSLTGTWTPMGPYGKPAGGGAGRLNFVRFDPTNSSTIYVGAPDGGLWKSTNGGTSWTTNTDQLTVIGVTDLSIDPNNTQIMYLATGDGEAADSYSVGVLKSTDGGATWNTTGLNWAVTLGRTISKLVMHPTNSLILLAATSNGIYRTTNGGTSWTQTSTGNFKDLELNPTTPNTVYISGTIFRRSTDNGVTWTTITSGLPTTGIQRIATAVTPANNAYVYLLIGRSSDQGLLGVYRSTNNGVTFTLQKGPTGPNLLGWNSNGNDAGGQAFYDLSLAVDPNNADILVVGGVNVWRSTNGGVAWTIHAHWTGSGAPYVHADIHEIVYTSSSTYFVACDGGLFRTTNTGSSFSDLSGNMAIAQQYRVGLSASIEGKLITGHQDNGTNKLEAGVWSQVYGGDGMDCFIDRTNNNTLFESYVYGDYRRSTNNGAGWTAINTGLPAGTWLSAWHQDPVTAATLYAGGRPAFYRSTNSGTNWSALGTPSGSGSIIEFAIAPSNNQIIYTVKSNAVSRSTNGGTTWSNVTGTIPTASASLTNVAISSTDPNKVWVTLSGFSATNKVFVTTDGGATWTNFSVGLPNVPCNTIVYQTGGANDPVYVGTDVGVFYKDNSQGAWTSFFSGLPRCGVRDLEIYYPTGRLRAATFGRGTWESDLHTNGLDPPVAEFSANQLVCAGNSTVFTDLSSSTPTTWSWSFPGGTPSTAAGAGPHTITYNTVGVYDAILTTSNAYGSDTETKTGYITVLTNTAGALPIVEGFTSTTFPPTNWVINNTGLSYTWEQTTTAGTAPTTGNSMRFDNYVNNHTGSNDEIILPASNFMGLTSAQLSFDVAYAPYNGTYYDGLEVLVSTDCGATYSSVYFKENTVLATNAAITTGIYVPGAWRNDVVNLDTYINNPNVLVMFRNIAGYGQALYIDNINLSGTMPVTAAFTATPSAACIGQSVTYTSTSSGATSWNWSFGVGATPATATGVGPHVVTYSSAGTKTATLTINGSGGTTTQNVTITAAPASGTLSGTQAICSGGSSTFTSTVTGGTWTSSAPGTATINASSGVIAGIAAGTATMTYTVTGTGGCPNAADVRTVTVTAPPSAGTLSGNQTICANGNTTFSSTISGGTWTSSASGTASINPSTGMVTGVAGGSATMTYTVVGSGGCADAIAIRTVTVNATPIISLGSVTQTTTCGTNTGSIQITGSGTGVVSWSGAGSGSSATITLPYTIPNLGAGNYSVVFVNSNTCASNTLSQTIVDPTPPTAPVITPNGATTFCVGGSVTLTSSQASGNTWSSGGGTAQSISVTASGTYSVLYTNGSGCSATSASITVTVLANPTAPIISAGGATAFCAGGSADLTSSESTGNVWSVGGTSQTIAVNTAGNYTVTYTDGNGCSATSAPLAVTVNALPSAPIITASGPTTFCDGGTVNLTSSQGTGNVWSTAGTTQTIAITTAGTYTVTYTDGNGCSATSTPTSIIVNSLPVVALGSFSTLCETDAAITLSGGTPAGGTYSGSGVSVGTFDPLTAGVGITTITYTFVDANGCSNTSQSTISVDDCAGISALNNPFGFMVFPNPASDEITIVFKEVVDVKSIRVNDSQGKLVKSSAGMVATDSYQVKVSDLAAGIYYLEIETENATLHEKIRIEK